MAKPYSHYAESAGQIVWCMWGTGEPAKKNIVWVNDWRFVTCPRCARVKVEFDSRLPGESAAKAIGPTPAAFPVNNPAMDGDVRVVYDRDEGKVIPFRQWLEKNKK